jgi:hypothetical protein
LRFRSVTSAGLHRLGVVVVYAADGLVQRDEFSKVIGASSTLPRIRERVHCFSKDPSNRNLHTTPGTVCACEVLAMQQQQQQQRAMTNIS